MPRPRLAGELWQSQNFLRRRSVAEKIVRLADLSQRISWSKSDPGEACWHGPFAHGPCGRVIAVERDEALVSNSTRFPGRILPNVEVVPGDFLRYALPKRPYKVVANPPFKITSDLVARIAASGSSLTAAYLVMQAEAARRFHGRAVHAGKSPVLAAQSQLRILYEAHVFAHGLPSGAGRGCGPVRAPPPVGIAGW